MRNVAAYSGGTVWDSHPLRVTAGVQRQFVDMYVVSAFKPSEEIASDVVRTVRSARHGRSEGLHDSDFFTAPSGGAGTGRSIAGLPLSVVFS